MKNPFSFVSRLFEKRAVALGDWDDYWYEPVTLPTISSVKVDELSSLRSAAVYSCVRVIAETVATLPLQIFKRISTGGKERSVDHPLWKILSIRPNPEMTAIQYREAQMVHLLLWGNFYAQKVIRNNGSIEMVWPLRPDRMKPDRTPDGRLIYRYRPVTTGGPGEVIFTASEIHHIAGLGFNGVVGFSPISLMRESIGLAMAGQELASRFFGNDATPPTYLTHPGKLSDPARDNLKKSWGELYSGLKNKFKIAILEEGMDLKTVTMPLKDIQFIEGRKYQRSEICGFFRVPPHMIGDLEKASFANIEQEAISFVVNTIRPWVARVEQSNLLNLFPESEWFTYFPEHNMEGLLRGDIKSRYEAYATGRQWGWLSVDDIREKENMNPLPDGKGTLYLQPLNMVPAGTIASPPPGSLNKAYSKIFGDAINRIIKREVDDVKRIARNNNLSFPWIEEFYSDLGIFMRRLLLPVVESYFDLYQLNGVGQILSVTFLDNFIKRYVEESRDELRMFMINHANANQEIGKKMDEWIIDKPAQKTDEGVRLLTSLVEEVQRNDNQTKREGLLPCPQPHQ